LVYEKTVDDKETLVVQVFPANQKPCFIASEGIENGVYIRVGSHTRRAQGEILEELHLLRSRLGYDEVPVSDCPFNELNRKNLPPGLRSEQALHSLSVFRREALSGRKIPLRGAVLMLHPEPERFVPEAYVVISRMRGDRGRSTLESHDLTGSVPRQSEGAVALLERWLGRDPGRSGARYRSQRWALPIDAVREAVNNALFHRQYSIPGPIKIALYATRLEIFSPGHFAGPFIPESLGDGTSFIRNRVVCGIARRMELIEKRGTGIRLIQDSMKDSGLQAPLFEEGSQWFKVTLPMTRPEKPTAATDDADRVLELLETKHEIASSDVCALLGVSKATAVALLGRLIADGRLIRKGRGPKTRYLPV
jgi:predicted HTH transcriptional regulator